MPSSASPDVSFAVACYNALPYLESAVASALEQRDVTVEVLIVDDGSRDGSLERAERMAAADPRIRLLRTPANAGPGGARNLAIAAMRGTWYAVLDSDDLIVPARSRRLIDLAEREGADMVADNLMLFGEGIDDAPLFGAEGQGGFRIVGLDDYFARSRLFAAVPGYGFLKPMIRRELIERVGLRYNDRLRIGEDDEMVVRLLAGGARYIVDAEPMYRYRKHAASISHRLSLDHAERMMSAEEGIRVLIGPAATRPAYRARWRAMRRGLAFTRAIDGLKRRRPLSAIAPLLREPGALPLFREPLAALFRRWAPGGSR